MLDCRNSVNNSPYIYCVNFVYIYRNIKQPLLSAWLFYLQTPAGFTKGEALNTVPADNRHRNRSLAIRGPHHGGLIVTDWTRLLYHKGMHKRKKNRQGGGDRNTETE